ncbi:MAG: class A beta-lactamase-related serine hydrolase [Gammaproteobacteria bacterium]|jgi:beta-lactamase class A|nr:class A beta-lactamase-related serine hydrolase [Gammaproteobacteria bacterium]
MSTVMRLIASFLCVFLFLITSLPAWADGTDAFPSLWDRHDSRLQKQLRTTLYSLGLDKAVHNKKLSVALVDITNLDEPRVAEVNGDEMVYAASLPKIAILLGAFVEIEEGSMTLDHRTRESLTQMIRVSSNQEATRMLNRVGKERLLGILQSDKFHLYDPEVNGGLWVGKEYGKSAAFKRDPLHNLSHGATAMQVARFYYLLETGRLVGDDLSAEMKSMLGHPGINHKFVKGLADYPEAKIYRKSGSWRNWHADSALVEAEGHKYIIVGLAEDANGGSWLSRMIKPIHEFMVPTKLAALGR